MAKNQFRKGFIQGKKKIITIKLGKGVKIQITPFEDIINALLKQRIS